VEAGDDARPRGVDVVRGVISAGRLFLGQLGQVVAGGLQVSPIDIEPVNGAGRHGRGAGDGVEVRGGLEIGGDAPGGEDVEEMLSDPRVDIAYDRVFTRIEAIVASSAARATR